MYNSGRCGTFQPKQGAIIWSINTWKTVTANQFYVTCFTHTILHTVQQVQNYYHNHMLTAQQITKQIDH